MHIYTSIVKLLIDTGISDPQLGDLYGAAPLGYLNHETMMGEMVEDDYREKIHGVLTVPLAPLS